MAETGEESSQQGEGQAIRCLFCGGEGMDEMVDARNLIAPEPLIVLICQNCGFIMQFASRPGGPSADYSET